MRPNILFAAFVGTLTLTAGQQGAWRKASISTLPLSSKPPRMAKN